MYIFEVVLCFQLSVISKICYSQVSIDPRTEVLTFSMYFYFIWFSFDSRLIRTKGLVMLQDMIRAPTAKPMEVLLRQASPDTYKDVLKEVKAKEFYNLVIDTKPGNMNFFLKGVSVV